MNRKFDIPDTVGEKVQNILERFVSDACPFILPAAAPFPLTTFCLTSRCNAPSGDVNVAHFGSLFLEAGKAIPFSNALIPRPPGSGRVLRKLGAHYFAGRVLHQISTEFISYLPPTLPAIAKPGGDVVPADIPDEGTSGREQAGLSADRIRFGPVRFRTGFRPVPPAMSDTHQSMSQSSVMSDAYY